MFSVEQERALSSFADSSDRLLNLVIISTDSITGEIGEYIVCQILSLEKLPRGTKDIDAIDNKTGKTYQIKAKVISDTKYNYTISSLSPNNFDYLVVVYFDELYNIKKLLKVPSLIILDTRFKVDSHITKQYEEKISRPRTPNKAQKEINLFGKYYTELKRLQIIRSRKIVGDIGEYYACKQLHIHQCEKINEKGIDATDKNGVTYEIKTRRVYESARRNSNTSTRRLNNLVGKNADYLIVVTLDRIFKCSGMWIIPMKNILNLKSANLRIVNTTPGVMNLVPSKIEWLYDREPFKLSHI